MWGTNWSSHWTLLPPLLSPDHLCYYLLLPGAGHATPTATVLSFVFRGRRGLLYNAAAEKDAGEHSRFNGSNVFRWGQTWLISFPFKSRKWKKCSQEKSCSAWCRRPLPCRRELPGSDKRDSYSHLRECVHTILLMCLCGCAWKLSEH